MPTFLTTEEAKIKTQEGFVVKRVSWPCKIIRAWRDSDADYFMSDFDHEGAIIQECDKPCDCRISIYIEENGDKNANDWVVLYKSS